MQLPDPYTYYRNDQERRVFLVVDVDPRGVFNDGVGRVVLIEWGKSRHHPKYVNLETFKALVKAGSLVEFIPTL